MFVLLISKPCTGEIQEESGWDTSAGRVLDFGLRGWEY